MITPTTERETVLGILRELRDEMQTLATRTVRESWKWAGNDAASTLRARADGMESAARLIQQRIDAIEREEQS